MDLRPMQLDDASAAAHVLREAVADADRRAGRAVDRSDPERARRLMRGLERFPEVDPGGCWVAADGDGLRGFAAAIRRGAFWGLALLFVHPESQSTGVGRTLLDRALQTADGADVAMIMSSEDPRALRRYSRAGFDLHPAVKATGTVDRAAVPAGLPVRAGGGDDLDLVDRVDLALRGSSRAADAAFVLEQGGSLVLHEHGYACHQAGNPVMLGAATTEVAQALLWACLAEASAEVEVHGWTAEQGWAVEVALAARLRVEPAGPLFIRGLQRPPGPWLPSGWYF